jgi:hypothetical protein
MDSPSVSKKTVLQKLGEYKEFIALLAFFLGGVFWIFAYFATKEQLKSIQCLMNANLTAIQGRMDYASLSQLMIQNFEETASLEGKPSLTAAETVKRNQLKTAANEISRKLAEAETAISQGLNKLRSGECILEK